MRVEDTYLGLDFYELEVVLRKGLERMRELLDIERGKAQRDLAEMRVQRDVARDALAGKIQDATEKLRAETKAPDPAKVRRWEFPAGEWTCDKCHHCNDGKVRPDKLYVGVESCLYCSKPRPTPDRYLRVIEWRVHEVARTGHSIMSTGIVVVPVPYPQNKGEIEIQWMIGDDKTRGIWSVDWEKGVR